MSVAKVSDRINTKLGNLIHGWSIPAITTCPGASGLCRARCYATHGFFRMPSVVSLHRANLDFSLTKEFSSWMLGEVRRLNVTVMRVHVAGDFYDLEYLHKWHTIAAATPKTTYFAYSRSWRAQEMLPDLIQLGQLPNFKLWWSIDRETGPAPIARNIRRAYMAINDVDASCAPDDCDLVFRDDASTVMKKANGIQVCPVENGLDTPITCTSCGICWDKRRTPLPTWQLAMSPYLSPTEINVSAVPV